MESKKNRVYIEQIVKQSQISNKYHHLFIDFLVKDYDGKTFEFNNRIQETVCVDIDEMENDRGGNNNNTMDLAVGIAKYDDTRQTFSSCRMLPVELKLGCLSFDEIKKDDLIHKDQYTRGFIISHSLSVDEHSVFLFTKKVSPSAKSEKSRWENESNSNALKHWEMMSPQEYNDYIGFKNDYPYKPITDVKVVVSILNNLFDNEKYDECIDYIDKWKNNAENYFRKYMLDECNAIVDCLLHCIDNNFTTKDISSEYHEYFEMQKEELSSLYILL